MAGYGVVTEDYIIGLQMVFLHVYIATDYLPLTFRLSLAGLSPLENLNFFIPAHRHSIEQQWMGNVVQDGPPRFQFVRTDINFLRGFYPVIIINAVYLIWFFLLRVARRVVNRGLIDEEKGVLNKFLDNTAGRLLNTTDQIWRYQFLATLWACFLQFHNLAYPADSDRS